MSRAWLLGCACVGLVAQSPDAPWSFNDGQLKKPDRGSLPLDRNRRLDVHVDRAALSQALGLSAPNKAKENLSEDARVYEIAIQSLLLTRSAEFEKRVTLSQVKSLQAKGQREEALKLRAAMDAGSGRRSSEAFTDFQKAAFQIKGKDPALYQQLNDRLLEPGPEAYEAMVEAIRNRLKGFKGRLDQLAAPQPSAIYTFQLIANWVGEDGRSRALHLPGYDQIATGPARPFGNLDLQFDDRFKAEWKAAEDLAPFVDRVVQTDFKPQIQQALSQLKQNLESDTETLKMDFDQLLSDLLASPKAQELRRQLESWKTQVQNVKNHCEGFPQSSSLLSLSQCVGDLENLIQDLKQNAAQWLVGARSVIQELPLLIRTEAEKAFAKAQLDLKQFGEDIVSIFAPQLQEMRKILQQSDALWKDVDATSRRAVELRLDDASSSLDTALDLREAKDPRPETSDAVQLAFEVKRQDSGASRTLLSGTQIFRVEQYGFFWDTPHAALMAIHPEDSRVARPETRLLPGLIINARYGIRDWDWWNHILTPSFGISAALVDFDPNRDPELGLALNLSLFRNLISVGVGKNLQTRTRYTYVGLNPLVLYRLMR
jgi:hypothetical protein